jgi:hypothetical protein
MVSLLDNFSHSIHAKLVGLSWTIITNLCDFINMVSGKTNKGSSITTVAEVIIIPSNKLMEIQNGTDFVSHIFLFKSKKVRDFVNLIYFSLEELCNLGRHTPKIQIIAKEIMDNRIEVTYSVAK